MPLHDEVLEDVIHHGLEYHWAVSESKEHDKGFKEAVTGVKGHLPLIAFLDLDIVEPLPYIQLSEVSCPAKLYNELWDNGQRVVILHCHGIEHIVVLYQVQ